MIDANNLINVHDLFQVEDKYYRCARIDEDGTQIMGINILTQDKGWFPIKHVSAIWKISYSL